MTALSCWARRAAPFVVACAAACSHNSATSDAGTTGDAATAVDCSSAATHIDKAVCAANALLATLPSDQLPEVNLAFTASTDRTLWSNLPGVTRAGLKMSALSTGSQAAALALMQIVLSPAGTSDLTGVRAADDYLNSLGGGAGGGGPGSGSGAGPGSGSGGGPGSGAGPGSGGGGYGSGNYSVAIFGTPSATGTWEVMFGGHHMAYNVTFTAGVGYPTPNHLGVEPKAPFTINGATYQPMSDEGAAIAGIFQSLSTSDLATAYLSGQTFADVLIGPVEYGSGSTAAVTAKYPTGANRTGVLVSSMSAEQQALVTTAIEAWVDDFDPAISDALVAAYTSADAFADTYVAWGGTQSAGVDVDVNGTYMRIDGPRAWIEVACQAGVVITGVTHYHSIYRDKSFDYAGTL